LRLLKARQLLSDPGLPVAQAAMDSGYRHLSLFNSLFKKRFGMTPTEWRQQTQTSDASDKPREPLPHDLTDSLRPSDKNAVTRS
jgi:AraC-like DNA-binding protein